MKKKAKRPRNYRATDATFINVGASKKRDTGQNARIAALEKAVRALKEQDRVTSGGVTFFTRELQQLREAHAHTAVNLDYLLKDFAAYVKRGTLDLQPAAKRKAAKRR